jgi:thiol-disulfide isomerase/thioredoxin
MAKRLVPVVVLIVAVVGALALTAGGDEPEAPPVPQLSVPRLDGGGEFALSTLASSETPTLLWFWAPWCPVCNGEAPKLERFAAENGNAVRILAIGGRDQAANGPPFVAEHGLESPTVLFDESMAVWDAYKIAGQPVAVLLDREGRERERWFGVLPAQEVLDAARAL